MDNVKETEHCMNGPRYALVSLVTLLFTAKVAVAGINFIPAEPVTVSHPPGQFLTADLNRDGRADLIFISPHSGGMQVLLGSASSASRFTSVTSGSLRCFGKKLGVPSVGDLNGNGILDVVVPDEGRNQRGVWILLGLGDGTCAAPAFLAIGRNPRAVARA